MSRRIDLPPIIDHTAEPLRNLDRENDRAMIGGHHAFRGPDQRSIRLGELKERNRIRTDLIDWLVGRLDPKDAGLINGRRIVTEIDRICPKE